MFGFSLSRTELITSIVLWSASGPLPIFVADKVSGVELFIDSISYVLPDADH